LYTYQPVEILSLKGLLFLCVNKIILDLYSRMYSGEHGISHANLYVIKKKLSSLSFIVIIINNEVGYAWYMWSWLMFHLNCHETAGSRYLILIKLSQWNVQCVRNSVLATVQHADIIIYVYYSLYNIISVTNLYKGCNFATNISKVCLSQT
jgi:hypothetical protein